MKTTKSIFSFFLLCAPLAPALASSADSVRSEHLSLWNNVSEKARLNPALHGAVFNHSYSELAVNVDYTHQTTAFVLEKGTGSFLPSVSVNSFVRLNEKTAVWGSAAYMAGRQYGVKWNSTVDYDLLNPYILADSVGGDTHRERYSFSGGFATNVNKFRIGGEAIIRSEHGYTERDPRMRGIVTELTLRAGGAYDALNYRWALGVEGNIYKQTNDVEFYNELGKMTEYQMTGLGTYYARFSGEDASLYYKGGGIGLSLDANPLGKCGFYGNAKVWRRGYERQVTSANSVPITRLVYNAVDATFGWRHTKAKRHMALFANWQFTKRSGDENIVGKSSSQYYPVTGKLTLYKNYLMDANLNGIYGVSSSSSSWHTGLKVGLRNNRERYVYPERKMDRMHFYATATGQWMKQVSERFSIKADIDASYYANMKASIIMPYTNMENSFTAYVNHNYRFQKASYACVNAKVRGDCSLGKLGIFLQLGGGAAFCSESELQTSLQASAGITF